MKIIIKNLSIQLKNLRDKVQEREDYVDNRSAKWQESDKCETYQDVTLEIDERADDLDLLIDQLKDINF